ncbi:hypothetical protein Pla108_38200 [Botrimarina colliarenosi]|uniref:Uncharacterized protein n=1 Tax=Botrimarina colliarenosi TaxID=2528001 RepID=A0A5C6A499_9BACT|nr:hypothetical protein [Botrimarina colliarenosi]TWT94108.1 hypothetical protein Pla108_38200 [Botrimarina colliarenosi]
MSEYQYVEFQAVDRPLTDRELAYARKQSTRAEISRRSFHNEYHFGDFRGDVIGMLQRGYDVHLHYANFGIRTVAIRLPARVPFAKAVWSSYIVEGLSWAPDRRGSGGVLTLAPYHEADELEELWEFEPCMRAIVGLRTRLMAGDLRVLYLFWLAAAIDGQHDSVDAKEPPVPGGLAKIAGDAQPFLEFFGLEPHLLGAAAEVSAEAPDVASPEQRIQRWVESKSDKDVKSLLRELLSEDSAAVKAATVARILGATTSSVWPTVTTNRNCQELLDRAAQLRQAEYEREQERLVAAENRKAAKQAQERKVRMKQMVDEPKKWLRKADELVAARGTDNYEAAAEVLDELREALAADGGEQLSRKHAAHLAKQHPTLNRMKSALRKRGLLE